MENYGKNYDNFRFYISYVYNQIQMNENGGYNGGFL